MEKKLRARRYLKDATFEIWDIVDKNQTLYHFYWDGELYLTYSDYQSCLKKYRSHCKYFPFHPTHICIPLGTLKYYNSIDMCWEVTLMHPKDYQIRTQNHREERVKLSDLKEKEGVILELANSEIAENMELAATMAAEYVGIKIQTKNV